MAVSPFTVKCVCLSCEKQYVSRSNVHRCEEGFCGPTAHFGFCAKCQRRMQKMVDAVPTLFDAAMQSFKKQIDALPAPKSQPKKRPTKPLSRKLGDAFRLHLEDE